MIGFFYHAFRVSDSDGHVLMMDKVEWKDDWPAVAKNSPSDGAPCPVL